MRKKILLVISIAFYSYGFSFTTAQAQSSSVDYGVVTRVNQIKLDESGNTAATVAGALAGGAIGYQIGKDSSSGKKRRGIAGGAAVGGMIGNRATRGSNTGYEYTVKLLAGNSITIITEQGKIDVGDCVTVERGESANIRRVSELHCQDKETQASAEHIAEAKECEAAKAAMLEAETAEALNAAVDKARILCEE